MAASIANVLSHKRETAGLKPQVLTGALGVAYEVRFRDGFRLLPEFV
jgi:hypothetical protein